MYYSNVTNDDGRDFLQVRNKDFCQWFSRHCRNLRAGYYKNHLLKCGLLACIVHDIKKNLLTFEKDHLSLINELETFFHSKDHTLEWEEEQNCDQLVVQNSSSGEAVDGFHQEGNYIWLDSGKSPLFYGLEIDQRKYTIITF